MYPTGHVIAQAVSHWLSTAAQVRTRVWSSGISGGQSGAGAGFLQVFRFPLRIFIPPNSPSSQSPGAGIIGQKWPTCQVDPVWTPAPTMYPTTISEGQKKRISCNPVAVFHYSCQPKKQA
jgi:hypothetical protein